jgi:hypothetical protein
MERVTGDVKSQGGVSGSGSVFVINNNGDNALTTLRYRFKSADFEASEDPFEAAGKSFARGSYIVRNVSQSDFAKATHELGVAAYAVATVPTVKMHPARAARVAILHTWSSTQTEGWWRQAFDVVHVPFTYINVQDVAKDPNLNAKYDVILFPPSGNAQSIVQGMPMWRNPMPWKKTALTPNMGVWDQTDDIRPGLGLQGVQNIENFVTHGGVLVAVSGTADFAITYGLANGVSANREGRSKIVGSLLRTRIVDDASPLVYGVSDSLAVYSEDGESFSISNTRGGRGGGRFGRGEAMRATGRGTADDPDVVQGRPQLAPRNVAPAQPTVEPWQATPITDDQLRNPLSIIPPDQRPRVALRFSDQRDLLVSGLLDGGSEVAQRPVVVDVPLQKGHVILFANNPIYRGETLGTYPLVFNAILNFDHLDAGRKLDPK